jgi:type III secretory pathway component EscV
MDFDSIIYIVIAIVLAVVNAVAQKKKKAQTSASAPKPSSSNQFQSQDDELGYEQDDEESVAANPFEILFGEQPASPVYDKHKEEISGEEINELELVVQPEPEPELTSYQKQMQEKAKEFVDFQHEKNVFDFDEDSIASSAIGNALTEEEEEEKAYIDSQNDIMNDFDGATAIVYSEVITPKYFSLGVNS